MEADFLTALFPTPVTLLHQELRPFSLGHMLILERHESPFTPKFAVGRIPEVDELFFAVWVCCRSFAECQRDLRMPRAEFDEQMAAWVKLCGSFDALEVMSAFYDYVQEGIGAPSFKPVPRGRQQAQRVGALPPGAPGDAVLLVELMGMGLPFGEAMDFPYGAGQWLHATIREREGLIRIEGKRSKDVVQMLMEAAWKEGWAPVRMDGSLRLPTEEEKEALSPKSEVQSPKSGGEEQQLSRARQEPRPTSTTEGGA